MSRRRILDSAQKVLELYGGSRMILELEFFGEVGTGLGPTLEFYTLLAHELQVWRLAWVHMQLSSCKIPCFKPFRCFNRRSYDAQVVMGIV